MYPFRQCNKIMLKTNLTKWNVRYLPLSFTPGYKYVLDHTQITLPYPVNEDEGRAQFDKSKRRLVVTLPVIPAPPVVLNGHADDEDAENKAILCHVCQFQFGLIHCRLK